MPKFNIIDDNTHIVQTINDPDNITSKYRTSKYVPKKIIIPKYTLKIFLEKAKDKHKDNHDYSEITEEHVKNNRSIVPIICKCGHRWKQSIQEYLSSRRKSGCPKCSGRMRWNNERFLNEVHVHQGKYFYDENSINNITHAKSRIKIRCHRNHEWETSVECHINRLAGCKSCDSFDKRGIPHIGWNKDRFLEESHKIHANKFIYNEDDLINIKNSSSLIRFTCNSCGYCSSCTLSKHIYNKQGCKQCTNKIPWNSDKFILASRHIHQNKFTYNDQDVKNIKNCNSKIRSRCEHGHEWVAKISCHITDKSGCPDCSIMRAWTLERFLETAKIIHKDKYSYEEIDQSNYVNIKAQIIAICKKCSNRWITNFNSHIHGKYGCPCCSGNKKYDMEYFLKKAHEVHGEKYDYSLIKEHDIVNKYSLVKIRCSCGNKFKIKISNHILHKIGCPACFAVSKGEEKCAEYLDNVSIKYYTQYRIDSLKSKRFDFMFETENIKFLLEFDGRQHFKFIYFFHRTDQEYEYRKNIDIIKTRSALQEEYKLIRIDFSQIDNVAYHIEKAIQLKQDIYYSNEEMYKYISDNL